MRSNPTSYGPIPKALHWLTVLLVIAAWLLGSFGDELPEGRARATGLLTHISFGIAVLAIAAIRIPWRAASPPPPAEPIRLGGLPLAWAERASNLVHIGLYALLIAVPCVGIVLQFALGHSLPLFGIGEIAPPFAASKALAEGLKEVHEVGANALIVLAGLHMLAALLHHFLLGDATLIRMLPGRRARG